MVFFFLPLLLFLSFIPNAIFVGDGLFVGGRFGNPDQELVSFGEIRDNSWRNLGKIISAGDMYDAAFSSEMEMYVSGIFALQVCFFFYF